MNTAKRDTIRKLSESFGFDVVVISSKTFEAHQELRTRYTVKRPNGSKYYHAIMLSDGNIV